MSHPVDDAGSTPNKRPADDYCRHYPRCTRPSNGDTYCEECGPMGTHYSGDSCRGCGLQADSIERAVTPEDVDAYDTERL